MRTFWHKTVAPLALLTLLAACTAFIRSKSPGKKGGIYLNIAADALVGQPDWNGSLAEKSKEQLRNSLEAYIDDYAGTQVSVLLFNVNYQRAFYDSNVMEAAWDLADPEAHASEWFRQHWILHKKGIDPYEICIRRSREKKISPWLSVRMNDHHYFNDSTRINKLWWNHPELRQSPYAKFDYARKEVRDYYKSFIREALEKYDVDGIELDWIRSHNNFKKGEENQGRLLLDQFMSEVKEIVTETARRRKHPVKLAVRVPSTPAVAESFGLDAAGWARLRLVDAIIPSNWFHPTNFDIPVEEWKRRIGARSRCMILPAADNGVRLASSKHLKVMTSTAEILRGFSAAAFDRGADGIYYFNNFQNRIKRKQVGTDGSVQVTDDKALILTETGQLATASGKPRTHVYTYRDPDTSPAPVAGPVLEPGKTFSFQQYLGPRTESGEITVRVGLDKKPDNAGLTVKLNNQLCVAAPDVRGDPAYLYDGTKVWHEVTHVSETGARVLQFKAPGTAMSAGYNRIELINNLPETLNITWLDVHVAP